MNNDTRCNVQASDLIVASVIICAHNPKEKYLKRVLKALEAHILRLSDRVFWSADGDFGIRRPKCNEGEHSEQRRA